MADESQVGRGRRGGATDQKGPPESLRRMGAGKELVGFVDPAASELLNGNCSVERPLVILTLVRLISSMISPRVKTSRYSQDCVVCYANLIVVQYSHCFFDEREVPCIQPGGSISKVVTLDLPALYPISKTSHDGIPCNRGHRHIGPSDKGPVGHSPQSPLSIHPFRLSIRTIAHYRLGSHGEMNDGRKGDIKALCSWLSETARRPLAHRRTRTRLSGLSPHALRLASTSVMVARGSLNRITTIGWVFHR
ncbi:hypothetical protein EDB89DRAFT_1070890 [Lactarius sanguifluus]|nr:hypothetical protein EDB89DRAFT_1070890 [Lactarius sanguifluus]